MVSAGIVGSVVSVIVAAPESSALATISVRIVSSVAPGYASRRSSRRWSRSTRVSPRSCAPAYTVAPACMARLYGSVGSTSLPCGQSSTESARRCHLRTLALLWSWDNVYLNVDS
jgi:hypothetical protein